MAGEDQESLAFSPVCSGTGFLLFPFLQYVICCLQCSVLLNRYHRFGQQLPAKSPFPSLQSSFTEKSHSHSGTSQPSAMPPLRL